MNDQGAKINRRTLLTGAEVAALAPVAAHAYTADEGMPDDINAALDKFRSSIPSNFDHDYVEHAVVPFFLSSVYQGERPLLPMIDLPLTKENALPCDFWGLLYKDWKPRPEEGVTVFLQGLENRGADNLRKRIYFSAMTPDLYRAEISEEGCGLLRPASRPEVRRKAVHAALPRLLLRHLLGSPSRREGRRDPGRGPTDRRKLQHRARLSQPDTPDRLRKLHGGARAARPAQGVDRRKGQGSRKRTHPGSRQDDCLVLAQERRERGAFGRKDIVFEVFHNFVALSQWGNTIFGIMSRLSKHGGDAEVQASFMKTMSGDYDHTQTAVRSRRSNCS